MAKVYLKYHLLTSKEGTVALPLSNTAKFGVLANAALGLHRRVVQAYV
jgi:hypothetical protein